MQRFWHRVGAQDVLLWAVLVAVVVVAGWSSWAQIAVGALLAGMVAFTGRRWPVASLLASAGALLAEAVGAGDVLLWPVAISTAGCYLAGRRMANGLAALPCFVVVAAAGLLLASLGGNVWDWVSVVGSLLFFGVLPWLAGRYGRLRAGLAAAGWQRAEQLEREHQLIVAEARLRERTRIARDMHDSLGHDLSLIAMRAGALELDRGLDPARQAAAGQLRASAVEATERLRDIVDVLRGVSGDDGSSAGHAGESIADLTARARESGMDVELSDDESGEPISPLVALTAYRVTQEGLTNAAKHAPGAAVRIRLLCGEARMLVMISNGPSTGTRQPGPASGRRGLAGLQERVRMAGGSLQARQWADGYELTADLPLTGAPTEAISSLADDPAGPDGARAAVDDQHSESARQFAHTRRATRRDVAGAVGLSLALCAAALLILLGLRIYEVRSSWLDPSVYDGLRLGQTRAEVVDRLPAQQVVGRPDVPEPAIPAGSRCEYYRVPDDLFAGPIDVYRLCFADGLLVDKNVISAGPS